jgi:hypothetical protein
MEGSSTQTMLRIKSVLIDRLNRYEAAVVAALAEFNYPVNECVEGVVFSDAHVLTWVVLGTALTNKDVASDAALTSVNFHAEAFRMRFTTVLRTTDAFLVCHGFSNLCRLRLRIRQRLGYRQWAGPNFAYSAGAGSAGASAFFAFAPDAEIPSMRMAVKLARKPFFLR